MEDLEVFIAYYKPKTYIIEHRFGVERKSVSVDIQDLEVLDEIKTNTAKFVNLVHMLDASYLRRIVNKVDELNINIITIHDGFCVHFSEVGLLINYANEAFKMDESCGVFHNINKFGPLASNSIII